jgi:hypothetical protein
MRGRTIVNTRLLVAACMLALTVATTAQAATAVYVENHSQPSRLSIKPHGYYSHTSLQGLSWSGWGEPTTTAHGNFIFQFCVEENCTVSPFYAEPVVVTLSGIQRCHTRLAYTLLALDVEAELPDSSFKGYRTSVAACVSTHPRSHSHAHRTHA